MAVPVVIFAVCLAAGAFAASAWLPELARGPVAGIAFLVVCGLIGAGLGLVGLHVYLAVELAEQGPLGRIGLASQLASMLSEAGTVFGLALAVYLLAPRASREQT